MQKYWIVGTVLLSASMCHSQESNKPVDVIVFVKASSVPSRVDYGARSQVTWMFNRIGVRILWRDGVPGPANRPEETWVIKVDFNSRVPPDEPPGGSCSPNEPAIGQQSIRLNGMRNWRPPCDTTGADEQVKEFST